LKKSDSALDWTPLFQPLLETRFAGTAATFDASGLVRSKSETSALQAETNALGPSLKLGKLGGSCSRFPTFQRGEQRNIYAPRARASVAEFANADCRNQNLRQFAVRGLARDSESQFSELQRKRLSPPGRTRLDAKNGIPKGFNGIVAGA